MKLRYFLTNSYENLRNNIEENLSRYSQETSWAESYFDGNFEAETNIEVSLPQLVKSSKPSLDVDNVKILYPALRNLTPEQAMDGRLWTHLAHIEYWDYMHARWGIDGENTTGSDSDDAENKNRKLAKQIKDRYFLSSNENSRSLIRNGIARLWWFGYLTYDPNNTEDHFALTNTLLDYQDTQAALLERTFGKNPEVLKVCLTILAEYMPVIREKGGRTIIQDLGKYVNILGGTYFLDTMDKTVLKEKITAFIGRKLQG